LFIDPIKSCAIPQHGADNLGLEANRATVRGKNDARYSETSTPRAAQYTRAHARPCALRRWGGGDDAPQTRAVRSAGLAAYE
jgi:hypothetical protein